MAVQASAACTDASAAATVIVGWIARAPNPGGCNVDTNRDLAAAIQIGIWEGLYDTGFNLTSGAVRFSAVSSAVSTIFANIVALLNTSDALDNAFVMVLSSDRRQDVITGRRPPDRDLPEPGSVALLGLGAAAAALIRRRRR